MKQTKMKKIHPIALLLAAAVSFTFALADAPTPPAPPDVELAIQLTDGSRVIGKPVELTALPLKLEFTKLDIPLHLLAQLEFTANRAALAVKFRNNDTLTGTLELERVKLRTSFGEATIPVARIAKVSFALVATKP